MEDNRGEGSRADPLCEVGSRLDHGGVTRGRVWLWVVGAVGVLALVYALTLQIVRPTSGVLLAGFVWPLLGVTPLLGLGLFFTAFSDNREGSYIVVAGSAMAVGSAFEVHVRTNPEVAFTPTFALVVRHRDGHRPLRHPRLDGGHRLVPGRAARVAVAEGAPSAELGGPARGAAAPVGIADDLHLRLDGPAQRPPQPVCRRGARVGRSGGDGTDVPARPRPGDLPVSRAVRRSRDPPPAADTPPGHRWRLRGVRALGSGRAARASRVQRADAHHQHHRLRGADRHPGNVHPRRLPLWSLRSADRRSRCRCAAVLIAAHRHPVCVRGRRTGGAPRLRADGVSGRRHHRGDGAGAPAGPLPRRGLRPPRRPRRP